MFEIDKAKFGAFVAQLRKEKGLMQKELAEKLYVSDKAVSKWERGLSIPDVAILVPLADILGVTVTELLECRRLPKDEPMGSQQTEEIVKKVICLSEGAFSKISTEKAPQGIISVIKYLDFFRNMDIIYKEDFFISRGERALSLYSLRDPGNLGAVIRSAVAFGVQHIVLSADSADIYNPKTVRAAMGTMFGVKITVVKDFESFVRAAKECGRAVYAAELSYGARSIKEIDLTAEDIFIIGNEGHGIPKEISSACTGSVYIPISEGVESLNASVAASVFMWEQNNL